jgi:hypothetical protein
MWRAAALILALSGCDIPSVAYCPDQPGNKCPEAKPYYPEVTVVLTGAQAWHVDCDTPPEIFWAVWETVQWWNRQIPGIFSRQAACDSFEGVRFFYRLDKGINSGVGGLGWASITKANMPRAELLSVLRHETGHALGLTHTDQAGCLMVDFYPPNKLIELCDYERQMLADTYGSGF